MPKQDDADADDDAAAAASSRRVGVMVILLDCRSSDTSSILVRGAKNLWGP